MLGSRNLVESKSWIKVFQIYAQAMESFRCDGFAPHRVRRLTFSDSFILYTTDDTAYSYRALDSFCRDFVLSLTQSLVPIRGAMAFGNLYADPKSALYFGEALLDAHRVSESLDWIGFVLCDSAKKQLNKVGLPAYKRLNYANWAVPIKGTKGKDGATRKMFAYIISPSPARIYIEKIINFLHTMQSQSSGESTHRKYTHTIGFLRCNIREAAQEQTKSPKSSLQPALLRGHGLTQRVKGVGSLFSEMKGKVRNFSERGQAY